MRTCSPAPRLALLVSAVAAGLACPGPGALAATRTWTALADPSSWHDVASWMELAVPTFRDDVVGAGTGTVLISTANARANAIGLTKAGLTLNARRLRLGQDSGGTPSTLAGTLSINTGAALELLNGATLTAPKLAWTGGRIDGYNRARVDIAGASTIAGNADKLLRLFTPLGNANDITLSFADRVDWTGTGDIRMGTGAVLEIAETGELFDAGGHRITPPPSTLTANALVRVLGSYTLEAGRTVIQPRLRNLGTLRVADTARLVLSNGFYINVADPDLNTYRAATQTLQHGTLRIEGTGQLAADLGSNNDGVRNGIATIGPDAQVILDGVARNAMPIRNALPSNGSADALRALRRVEGRLRLEGDTHFRAGDALDNTGRITIGTDAQLSLLGNRSLTSAGTIDNNGLVDAEQVFIDGAGAVLRIGSTGTLASLGLRVKNGGRARVLGAVNAPVTLDGGPRNRGTRLIVEASGIVTGDVEGRNGGALELRGGTIDGQVNLIGQGRFDGFGEVMGNFSARRDAAGAAPNLVVGTVDQAQGTLAVWGDLALDGTLALSLAGRAPGTGHDFIEVLGDTALGGTLFLTFDPAMNLQASDTFNVLKALGASSGRFAEVRYFGVPDHLVPRTELTDHEVTVLFTLAQPVPEPQTWLMLAAGLGLLGARAWRLRGPA